MCGEKGYYFSNLNLKEDDVVIITVDPDIVDIGSGIMANDLGKITNMFKHWFKPHQVLVVIKGIELSRVDKDKLIKHLQEN